MPPKRVGQSEDAWKLLMGRHVQTWLLPQFYNKGIERMLNGLGLFAGIGGLELGLERSGLVRTRCFVEFDPYAQRVLARRFPDVPIWDDVRSFHAPEGSFDAISFGFPCQDISVAGRRAGIEEGTRSGLWSEGKRIISEVRPSICLIENVAALFSWFDIEGRTALPEIDLSNPGDRDRIGEEIIMDVIQEQGITICIRDLAEIGYNAEWCIISAADMGAPHLRKRIFIVAYPQGNRLEIGRMASRGQAGQSDGGGEVRPE